MKLINALSSMIRPKYVAAITAVLAVSPAWAQADQSVYMSDSMKMYMLVGMLIFQIFLAFTISGIIKTLLGNRQLWLKLSEKKKGAAAVAGLVLLSSGAMAQAETAEYVLDPSLENLLLWLNAALLVFNVFLIATTRSFVRAIDTMKREAEGIPVETEDFFSRISSKLSDAVPVEREGDVLMEDHDYDGIQELDNNLPPWWVAGFYITIACAVVYIFVYHVQGDGKIMQNELAAEMQQAEEEREAYLAMIGGMTDETNVELLTDASGIEKGREIFNGKGTCKTCHGENLEGGVGPNLTDDSWLHGCDIKDVFATIKYGVTEKGMISWQDQLSPTEMQQVASYIISMQGTNPANAKAAEGDVCSSGGSEMPEAEEEVMEEMPAQDSTIVTDVTVEEVAEDVVSEE